MAAQETGAEAQVRGFLAIEDRRVVVGSSVEGTLADGKDAERLAHELAAVIEQHGLGDIDVVVKTEVFVCLEKR